MLMVSMSTGTHGLLQADDPVVWRGPMASSAVDKFMLGTDWGPLDVLVVDMPPGENHDTGNIMILVEQQVKQHELSAVPFNDDDCAMNTFSSKADGCCLGAVRAARHW